MFSNLSTRKRKLVIPSNKSKEIEIYHEFVLDLILCEVRTSAYQIRLGWVKIQCLKMPNYCPFNVRPGTHLCFNCRVTKPWH
jgi:hypothetical protein